MERGEATPLEKAAVMFIKDMEGVLAKLSGDGGEKVKKEDKDESAHKKKKKKKRKKKRGENEEERSLRRGGKVPFPTGKKNKKGEMKGKAGQRLSSPSSDQSRSMEVFQDSDDDDDQDVAIDDSDGDDDQEEESNSLRLSRSSNLSVNKVDEVQVRAPHTHTHTHIYIYIYIYKHKYLHIFTLPQVFLFHYLSGQQRIIALPLGPIHVVGIFRSILFRSRRPWSEYSRRCRSSGMRTCSREWACLPLPAVPVDALSSPLSQNFLCTSRLSPDIYRYYRY